jgi:hypothetical protein
MVCVPCVTTFASGKGQPRSNPFAWGIHPSVSSRFSEANWQMKSQAEQLLRVVRMEGEHWEGVVREQLDSGRNFFIILPGGNDAIPRFCRSFELKSDCLHSRFSKSDLLRMGQHVDPAAFDEMLEAWNAREQVVFLEQIDFPSNRPPKVKPFLVYSPVWGILSQHEEIMGAKMGLEEAADPEERFRLSQPVIYQWDRGKWNML